MDLELGIVAASTALVAALVFVPLGWRLGSRTARPKTSAPLIGSPSRFMPPPAPRPASLGPAALHAPAPKPLGPPSRRRLHASDNDGAEDAETRVYNHTTIHRLQRFLGEG